MNIRKLHSLQKIIESTRRFLALGVAFTLINNSCMEADPLHPLRFWHFLYLLDAELPAHFDFWYLKTEAQFSMDLPVRTYCNAVLHLKTWRPTLNFRLKQQVQTGLYSSNWSVTSFTQAGLLPLNIKKLSQYSFSSGTRLMGNLHIRLMIYLLECWKVLVRWMKMNKEFPIMHYSCTLDIVLPRID